MQKTEMWWLQRWAIFIMRSVWAVGFHSPGRHMHSHTGEMRLPMSTGRSSTSRRRVREGCDCVQSFNLFFCVSPFAPVHFIYFLWSFWSRKITINTSFTNKSSLPVEWHLSPQLLPCSSAQVLVLSRPLHTPLQNGKCYPFEMQKVEMMH